MRLLWLFVFYTVTYCYGKFWALLDWDNPLTYISAGVEVVLIAIGVHICQNK